MCLSHVLFLSRAPHHRRSVLCSVAAAVGCNARTLLEFARSSKNGNGQYHGASLQLDPTPPHPTPPHPTPRCRASARCVMSGFCSLCDVGGPSGNKGLRTQLCGWGWGWGRGWGELKPTWVLGANMCVCVFHYQAWFSHLLEHKSAPDCTNQPKRIHESPNLNKSKEI